MLNILKRKCPHCNKPIFRFSLTISPSRCASCNGLVKFHFWRHLLVAVPLYFTFFMSFPTSENIDRNTRFTIGILGILFFLILHALFVPVVAVPEKEEKKD